MIRQIIKGTTVITMAIALCLASSCSVEEIIPSAQKMGVVDVNQLFNDSAYVQQANKELQDNVTKMSEQLKVEQDALKKLLANYQANKDPKLLDQIKAKQNQVTQMTQDYQKKVQEEQNAGMQKFSDYVRQAVAKVAKEKHLATVINKTAVVYTDGTQLVDITSEVSSNMAK